MIQAASIRRYTSDLASREVMSMIRDRIVFVTTEGVPYYVTKIETRNGTTIHRLSPHKCDAMPFTREEAKECIESMRETAANHPYLYYYKFAKHAPIWSGVERSMS